MKRFLLAACAVLALMGVAHARRANDVLSDKITSVTWCYNDHEDFYEDKANCPEDRSLTVSQTGFGECKFISVKRIPADKRHLIYAIRAECPAAGCEDPPVKHLTLQWIDMGPWEMELDTALKIEWKK